MKGEFLQICSNLVDKFEGINLDGIVLSFCLHLSAVADHWLFFSLSVKLAFYLPFSGFVRGNLDCCLIWSAFSGTFIKPY